MRKLMLTVFIFLFVMATMAAIAEIFTGSLPVEGNKVDWDFAIGAIIAAVAGGVLAYRTYYNKPLTFQ
jgi:hypothetical protein